LQTEILAYTGQQLIPGLLFEVLEFGVIDLGSVSEEIDHLVMGRGVRCTLVSLE